MSSFGQAKTLLEVAVVLLGASVSARTVLALGPELLAGIVLVVAVAIAASYGIAARSGYRSAWRLWWRAAIRPAETRRLRRWRR